MMYPIQRSATSVCLYTTTTIQYILYNVIIQLWGVITMVNLFLVYFSALLLYTTSTIYYYYTIQYIHTYSGGIGNSKLSKALRETNHIYPALLLYTITIYYQYILYSIRGENSSAKGGFYLLYTTSTIQYKRENTPYGGQIFFEKSLEIWIFCCIFMGGGVYIKKVYNKLDTFPHECG